MSDDEKDSKVMKTWQNLLEAHKNVELSIDRVTSSHSIGYQFDIQAVSEHLILNNPAVYHIAYHIRLNLFDAVYRRFVGQTWYGREVASFRSEMATQPSRIVFKQPVYFHTSILDSGLLMVMELVTTLTPKDPLPEQTAKSKSQTLGWSVMRLFTSGQKLKETIDKENAPVKKLDLFQGSPRALLYMDEPVENNPGISLVPGCQTFVSFTRHSALDNVIHLFPENMILASDKKIPGISEQHVIMNEVRDYYLKAKVSTLRTCYIDQLYIELGVNVDKFEKELCRRVNIDRLRRGDFPDDGKVTTVAARGLRVGVHNGYCFVQKPQFFHVEPQAQVGTSRTSVRTNEPPGEALVLRSRLELGEMIFDPGVAVCFQLEYTLILPTAGHAPVHGSRTSMFHQSETVMVRWAWWIPSRRYQEVNVCLIGGATANPGKQFFFRSDVEASAELGCINFHFLTADVPVLPNYKSTSQVDMVTSSVDMRAPEQDSVDEDRVDMSVMMNQDPPEMEPATMRTTLPTAARKALSLSRAMYARLFSSEVPEIVDRHGDPAWTLDPSDPQHQSDLPKNIADILQTNSITIQFLAFTPPHPGPHEDPHAPVHTMFFSFHFYRFEAVATQRVALTKQLIHSGFHDNYAPRILRKIEPGERLDEGQAGLEVKYHVDPMEMKVGEKDAFLSYLATHKLHVDVWDGNSLMLIGSVVLPLKHLLRDGRSAVCAIHELEVILSEHADVAPTFTGDLNAKERMRPLGVSSLHRGRLYIRIGNVGYPSLSNAPSQWKREPLVVADMSGNAFRGGSVSTAVRAENKKGYCHVNKLADVEAELAELLVLNEQKDPSTNKENNDAVDADRRRKLTRMKVVRSGEDGQVMSMSIGKKALLNHQERALKIRDLDTVASYRDQTKGERIMELLTLSVTTPHTIRPTLGVVEFIELRLRNPFPTQQTITIECDAPQLRVVTEGREWRHFKNLSRLKTPVEEDMFGFDTKTSLPQVFLQPREAVLIPFRYQSFEADHRVAVQGPSSFQATPTSLQPIRTPPLLNKSMMVKAILRTSDGNPLSILQLNILPQPPVVDQTLRFYNPELTFLKKCVRLPPFHPILHGDEEFHVMCSDAEIVCQSKSVSHDAPREIFIKAPCGESPSIRKFYLCMYTDAFLSSPIQTWEFYIHSLQRIDVNGVLGQTSRFTLALRGTKCVRKVQCFPSHPQEMQISPTCSFLLPANGLSEVQVGIRIAALHPPTRYMYIHVVDCEYHQLVRSWLVVVKSREPIITKEFTIELPRSGSKGNNKMISYTNPYPHPKKFTLLTNRADLLHFKNSVLQLQGREKTAIGLRFLTSVTQCGKFPIHIFINDDDDKNEETFLVNVIYY